jgi:hypothetical protein
MPTCREEEAALPNSTLAFFVAMILCSKYVCVYIQMYECTHIRVACLISIK